MAKKTSALLDVEVLATIKAGGTYAYPGEIIALPEDTTRELLRLGVVVLVEPLPTPDQLDIMSEAQDT